MFYHFVHFSSHFLLTSIYNFSIIFWSQNRFGFKKILVIKLLDQSIVSKKEWKKNKRKPTSQLDVSDVSVFIRKNILNSSLSWSKSSKGNPWYRLLYFSASLDLTQYLLFLMFETLLCFLLYFINFEHAATTQK